MPRDTRSALGAGYIAVASRVLRHGLSGGIHGAGRRALRVASWALSGQLRERWRMWRVARTGAGHAALPSGQTAIEGLLDARFPQLRPLAVFPDPGAPRRLTLLTDSIGAGSLFGGVGTAMILAALLARRLDCDLRVVTRTEPPEPGNLGAVLRLHGITLDRNVDFLWSGPEPGGRGVPMGSRDLVLTTSWWTTWSALRAVPPESIVYLLQEDERLFYAAGDEQVRCAEVLSDPRLRFVINTSMLHAHFAADGLTSIAERGLPFEPAFPREIYFRGPRAPGGKRRFFFYARPNNHRNMFYRGLEAVAGAIEADVLPPDAWEFHFVGKDLPQITLPRGARLIARENMPWSEYAELVRSVDVGLSLMATPHPSYPPLDLAASGAVVVTNRFGAKTALDAYSRNIICTGCGVEELVGGLREAVELSADEPRRLRHMEANGIARDWAASMAPVLDRLKAEL